MFDVVLILAGLGLATILLVAFRRIFRFPRKPGEDLGPRSAVLGNEVESGPVSQWIFSKADFQFILTEAPELRAQFVRERRALALQWIAQTRNSLRAVMRLHRVAARVNQEASPALELKLALSYGLFLALARFVESYVWIRGPFAADTLVARLITASNNMGTCSDALLATIDPLVLERLKTGQSAI